MTVPVAISLSSVTLALEETSCRWPGTEAWNPAQPWRAFRALSVGCHSYLVTIALFRAVLGAIVSRIERAGGDFLAGL